jgi:hypothetical protein
MEILDSNIYDISELDTSWGIMDALNQIWMRLECDDALLQTKLRASMLTTITTTSVLMS